MTRDVVDDAWNLFHDIADGTSARVVIPKGFQHYPEKRLSFTDCTSISLMHKRSIDYIASFDASFDGIVTRLGQ
ncbi:MAG: hypothetical protein QMD78_04205 [Methanocellales archaeon]|nr:hypothetical protein [Methanocellales archaeon]